MSRVPFLLGYSTAVYVIAHVAAHPPAAIRHTRSRSVLNAGYANCRVSARRSDFPGHRQVRPGALLSLTIRSNLTSGGTMTMFHAADFERLLVRRPSPKLVDNSQAQLNRMHVRMLLEETTLFRRDAGICRA